MRSICEGTAGGINQQTRRVYIALWMSDGTLAADPDGDTHNAPTPSADHGKQREPSILRKVAKLTGAVVRHIADGATEVPAEEREKRMAICAGCDQFDAARTVCQSCGCGLTLKARWRSENCPLGKW